MLKTTVLGRLGVVKIDSVTQIIISIIASVGASSGFWAWFSKKSDKKSATSRLLLGLAYDRIITLGMHYIQRGWITKDEYDDFVKYLYTPYKEFGGNGLSEKIMGEVGKLPFSEPKKKMEKTNENQ
jgi:hypothetical protein